MCGFNILKMKIRKAKESDIETILKKCKKTIEFQVDPNIKGSWSKKQIKNLINSKDDVVLIAEENELIGFVIFAHHIPTHKVTFENAWINPKHRGKEIISKLTKEGLKQLRKKGATYICGLAKEDNKSSIKFLKKNKFKKGCNFVWMHRNI